MSVTEYVLVAMLVAAGATTQACIGIGMGLIAGPLLVTLEPTAVPGSMLIIAAGVNIRNAVADRAALKRPELRRNLAAAPIGLAAGIALLTTMSERALAISVSLFVLGAVAVQLLGLRLPTGRAADCAAGAGTAFSSAVAALPGPVYVLFASHWSAAALRATMAAYMLFVSTAIIGTLVVIGDFGWRQLWIGLSLLPAVALGLPAGRWLRPRVDGDRFGIIVLTVAAASAAVVLVREVLSG